MAEKIKVNLKIDGVEYTFVGEETKKYMEEIAKEMNDLVNELRSKNPYLSHVMTMTLVAYTFLDGLNKEKIKVRNLNIFVEKYDSLKHEYQKLEKENQKLRVKLLSGKNEISNANYRDMEIKYKAVIKRKEQEIERLREELVASSNKDANI
jgi:cell division protein ZapA